MENLTHPDLTMPSFTHQPQHSSTPIKHRKQPGPTSMYGSPVDVLKKPLATTPQGGKLLNQHMALQKQEGSYLQQPQQQHMTLGQQEGSYLQQPQQLPMTLGQQEGSYLQQAAIPTRDTQHHSKLSVDASFPINLSSVLEGETIIKQRHELQMLIGELRDRDRELNQLVATHQHQMQAWEADRKRILRLEQKCAKLEGSLTKKCEESTMLLTQLRVLDSNSKSQSAALENSQQQLAMMSDHQSHASMQLKDMEASNRSLNDSVKGMISAVEQFEENEKKLEEVIKTKECQLKTETERNTKLEEKIKDLELKVTDLKEREERSIAKADEWQQKYNQRGVQLNRLHDEVSGYKVELEDQNIHIDKAKRQLNNLKTQLKMADERDARKDEVIEMQRSKQERMTAELDNLRQLYERQQRDLSLLHLNLESSKEMLSKHSAIYSDRSSLSAESPMKSNSNLSISSQSPRNNLQLISPIRRPETQQESVSRQPDMHRIIVSTEDQVKYIPQAVTVNAKQADAQKMVVLTDRAEYIQQSIPVNGAFIKEILDDKGTQFYTPEASSEGIGKSVKDDITVAKTKAKHVFVEPPTAKSTGVNRELLGSNKIKRSVKTKQASPGKVNQKLVKPTNTGNTVDSQDLFSVTTTQKMINKNGNNLKTSVSDSDSVTHTQHELKPVPQSYQQQEAEVLQSKRKLSKNSVFGSPKTLVQMYSLDDSLSELTHAQVNVEKQGQMVNQGQGQVVNSENHAEPVPYYYSMGHSSYNHDNVDVHEERTRHVVINEAPVVNVYDDKRGGAQQLPHQNKNQISYKPEVRKETEGDEQEKKSSDYVTSRPTQMFVDPRSVTPVTENNQPQVEPSPLGKLEMLLTESRQMVQQLEHTTMPKYFTSSKGSSS